MAEDHSGFNLKGNIDGNSDAFKAENMADPINPQDYVTKNFGDTNYAGSGTPVGATYVTLTLNGTLTDERVLTSGEGIDLTDNGAGSTIVISGEDATTSNKGIIEIATEDEVQTGTDTIKAVVPDTLQSVLPPIGSVMAWLKSFTNTPQTLPTGWVECDGATLSDADSVYNGQAVPDLNGDNRFLRGNSTSEGTGGSTTGKLATTSAFGNRTPDLSAGNHITANSSQNNGQLVLGIGTAGGSNTASLIKNSVDIIPTYYDVVWIIRIK